MRVDSLEPMEIVQFQQPCPMIDCMKFEHDRTACPKNVPIIRLC